ncbi:hypothetical protein [Winogradskyella sp.]
MPSYSKMPILPSASGELQIK